MTEPLQRALCAIILQHDTMLECLKEITDQDEKLCVQRVVRALEIFKAKKRVINIREMSSRFIDNSKL